MCVIFRTSEALLLNLQKMLNEVQALLGLILILNSPFFKEKSKFVVIISYIKTEEVLALETLEKLSLRLVSDFGEGS